MEWWELLLMGAGGAAGAFGYDGVKTAIAVWLVKRNLKRLADRASQVEMAFKPKDPRD